MATTNRPWSTFATLALLAAVPAMSQNNDFWRQQQQQQMQRQMQDQQRQQMLDQQRRQMQEQQRQQMLDQQRRQMQEQQRQQMIEQQRRQMQDQQRQQMVEQQRRQAQEQQRQQTQRQQAMDLERRQQQTRQQQATAQRQQFVNTQQGVGGRTVASNNFANSNARLNRSPTAGEIQKGFTGKVTPDGRALVKVRNKIYTVPASRVSGLSARLAREKAAASKGSGTANEGLRARTQALAAQRSAAGGGGKRGGGNGGNGGGDDKSGPRVNKWTAANLNDTYNRRNTSKKDLAFQNPQQREQFMRARTRALNSPGTKVVLGHRPLYTLAGKPGSAEVFEVPKAEWKAREKQARKRGYKGQALEDYMFNEYNKPFLQKHIDSRTRIILSNPREEGMTHSTSYFRREIEYLEKNGYRLSSDGVEMLPPRDPKRR